MVRDTKTLPELDAKRTEQLQELEKVVDDAIDRAYMPGVNECVCVDFNPELYPIEAVIKRYLQSSYEEKTWKIRFTIHYEHNRKSFLNDAMFLKRGSQEEAI